MKKRKAPTLMEIYRDMGSQPAPKAPAEVQIKEPDFQSSVEGASSVDSQSSEQGVTTTVVQAPVQQKLYITERKQPLVNNKNILVVFGVVVTVICLAAFALGSWLSSSGPLYTIKLTSTFTYSDINKRNELLASLDVARMKLRESGYKDSWIAIRDNSIDLNYGVFSSKSKGILTPIRQLKLTFGNQLISFGSADFVEIK